MTDKIKSKQKFNFHIIDKVGNEHYVIACGYEMIDGTQHFYIDEHCYFIASFHQAAAVVNQGEWND